MRVATSFVIVVVGAVFVAAISSGSSAAGTSREETSELLLALAVPSLEEALGGARDPLLIAAAMCPGDLLPPNYTCCCDTPFPGDGHDQICMTPEDCANKSQSMPGSASCRNHTTAALGMFQYWPRRSCSAVAHAGAWQSQLNSFRARIEKFKAGCEGTTPPGSLIEDDPDGKCFDAIFPAGT